MGFLREKQRGWENSGERKTYHKTPSAKHPALSAYSSYTYTLCLPLGSRQRWSLHHLTLAPSHPFVFALLFSLEETGTDQAKSHFLRPSKTGFGGRALWYVFPPPKIARYVLPPLAAFQFSGPRIPFCATGALWGTRHAFLSITFLSI